MPLILYKCAAKNKKCLCFVFMDWVPRHPLKSPRVAAIHVQIAKVSGLLIHWHEAVSRERHQKVGWVATQPTGFGLGGQVLPAVRFLSVSHAVGCTPEALGAVLQTFHEAGFAHAAAIGEMCQKPQNSAKNLECVL